MFTSSYLFLPHLTLPHLTLPYLTSPYLTLPHLTLPLLTSPHLTSPHLTLHHLTSHHLTSHHLTLYDSLSFLRMPICHACHFPWKHIHHDLMPLARSLLRRRRPPSLFWYVSWQVVEFSFHFCYSRWFSFCFLNRNFVSFWSSSDVLQFCAIFLNYSIFYLPAASVPYCCPLPLFNAYVWLTSSLPFIDRHRDCSLHRSKKAQAREFISISCGFQFIWVLHVLSSIRISYAGTACCTVFYCTVLYSTVLYFSLV